jgi:hypothetical protein
LLNLFVQWHSKESIKIYVILFRCLTPKQPIPILIFVGLGLSFWTRKIIPKAYVLQRLFVNYVTDKKEPSTEKVFYFSFDGIKLHNFAVEDSFEGNYGFDFMLSVRPLK